MLTPQTGPIVLLVAIAAVVTLCWLLEARADRQLTEHFETAPRITAGDHPIREEEEVHVDEHPRAA